jgi:O-antigen ligase
MVLLIVLCGVIISICMGLRQTLGWMGGLVFDRFGSYDFAWGALIVIGAAAFTLQWLMDERPPSPGDLRPQLTPT